MTRPSKDQYFLMMARIAAARATCAGRKVGCVLVDSGGHVLSTGYNGVPANVVHCCDTPCPGVTQETGIYSQCQAIHAEMNAVARCLRPHDVHTAYCTISPCTECVKILLATTCRRLVYYELHPASMPEAKQLWTTSGGAWLYETFYPEDLVEWVDATYKDDQVRKWQ